MPGLVHVGTAMLQAISDRIRDSRWLGYLIVALISVPFALWGIQAYFTGAGAQEVAEVNGEPIPTHVLDRQAGERRQQLREQFGGDLPDDFSDEQLRMQVLDELIDQALITQAASRMGMVSSDERVAEIIRNQEFFQRDGRFDPELYRQLLARSGIQPGDYEADMRRSDRVQQLESGLVASGFVLPSETRHVAMLEGQIRNASLVRVPSADVLERIEIDDAEVRAFYDENPERFRTPLRLQVAFVELDRDALAAEVDVTDEEIEAEFDRRIRQTAEEEAREASHILIELPADASEDEEAEVRERIERLHAEIRDGADFAELAREYSDDLGSADVGGELGRIERGDMVDAFEDALFALEEEGQVSDPVRTRFGYHLIQLTGVERGDRPELADLRDEIRSDLQRRQAENRFFDRVDDLASAAYENPGSLGPAADALGVEVRESDWFSRDEGSGIGSHAAVRAAAFDDDVRVEGRNSDILELGDRHVAVIRLVDEREPEPIPFADVEDEVRNELRMERAAELRNTWMAQLREELEAGTDPDTIIERGEPPIAVEGPYRMRLQEEDGGFGDAARRVIFDLPAPDRTDGGPVVGDVPLGDDETALALLHSVEYPEPDAQRVAQFEFPLQRLQANAEIEAWLATLRADADIDINERQLRRSSN